MNQNNKYCHSELVSESIVTLTRTNEFNLNSQRGSQNGFRTKSGMTGECGRSMVEMLGVLAIIGVLSVGGISGYTTAMNKHKANEILNAAAVRAMAVSAQIQSGVDPSTATGSVTSEPVGSAEIGSASPVGNSQFKLNFSGTVDPAICNQMKNIAGENSVVGVACNRLLYNNDMSPGVDNKNTNVDDITDGVYTCKNGFDPASKCEDCPTGQAVNASGACASTGPACPSFASTTNTGDYTGGSFVVTSNNTSLTCYCPTGKKYNDTNKDCNDGITTECYSWTRNECGAGQYCQFTPNTCTNNTKIAAPSAGVCKDIGPCGMGDVTGTNFRHSNYNPDSDCKQDWWTANAICAADGGRHLVSLQDVGCEDSKGNVCTSTTLSSVRSGDFGYPFWTTDMYTEGDADSCKAWGVGHYADVYGGDSRNDLGNAVLCL